MRDAIHLHTARIGQALASPQRLRALNLLAQRPRTVGDLAAELGESKASTSAHLKVLRAACLVVDERQGRQVWCRLASDKVIHLLVAARQTAEALLPELRDVVRQAAEDPEALSAVRFRQLLRDVQAGRVMLIDLRPAEEFRAGHLPGARSLPFDELNPADLKALATGDATVIAYCRGPWCVTARHGVQRLRKGGVNAKRLPAGVAEWQAQGLALERTASAG